MLFVLLFTSSRSQQDEKMMIQDNTNKKISGHLSYNSSTDSYNIFEAVQLFFGVNISVRDWSANTEKYEMIIDLSYSDILMPNGIIDSQKNWGFMCSQESFCSIDYDEIHYCQYNATFGKCNYAKTVVRIKDSDKPDNATDPKVLMFNLLNDTEDWTLGNYGVLGLSPRSNFWQYLVIAYESQRGIDFIQISLDYNIGSKDSTYSPTGITLRDSSMTVNSAKMMRKAIMRELPSDSAYWVLQEVYVSKYSGAEYYSTDACIANTLNNFIYIENFTSDIQPHIFAQLCNKTEESKCTRVNSVVGQVDNIYVELSKEGNDESSVRIILDPLEFINFDDDDNAVVVIGDSDDIPRGLCPNGTRLAFGKLLFSKASLVMRVTPGGAFEVGLYSVPNEFHIFIFMFCLFFTQLLFIIITLAILNTVKRNSRTHIQQRYKYILDQRRNSRLGFKPSIPRSSHGYNLLRFKPIF